MNMPIQYVAKLATILIVVFALFGCATNKINYGKSATDFSSMSRGMQRVDVEKKVGQHIREFECQSGTIVTYVYDRGWIGCIGEKRCKPEDIPSNRAWNAAFDVFSLGLFSILWTQCIEPCQKGNLEAFYNKTNNLIGVRELPGDRNGYCWTSENDAQQDYRCSRIYNHPQPSSIPEQLIIYIDPVDIPHKICDQFE
ncbi:MAG: hypothetical protein ABW153_14700 [Sedimenticola sp.]